ncbi:hypothetical protein ACFLUB_00275 [Chloroflexota bacterium]
MEKSIKVKDNCSSLIIVKGEVTTISPSIPIANPKIPPIKSGKPRIYFIYSSQVNNNLWDN